MFACICTWCVCLVCLHIHFTSISLHCWTVLNPATVWINLIAILMMANMCFTILFYIYEFFVSCMPLVGRCLVGLAFSIFSHHHKQSHHILHTHTPMIFFNMCAIHFIHRCFFFVFYLNQTNRKIKWATTMIISRTRLESSELCTRFCARCAYRGEKKRCGTVYIQHVSDWLCGVRFYLLYTTYIHMVHACVWSMRIGRHGTHTLMHTRPHFVNVIWQSIHLFV